MQIDNQSNKTTQVQPRIDANFAKGRQAFKNLDSAMSSGNLADAKKALTDLSNLAPKSAASDPNNPMKSKMDALTSAVNSGDLSGAKSAFADIKSAMSQRPPGAPAGAPSGPPPGEAPGGEPTGIDSASGKMNLQA